MSRADDCQPRGCANPFCTVCCASVLSRVCLYSFSASLYRSLSVASLPLHRSLLHVYNRVLTSRNMDPLSVTASIIAVLQLSTKVVAYLNEIKDASKDRAQCAIEISNLYNLLVKLRFRLEEGDAGQPWYTTVRTLTVENGPLDQYRQALETLQTKITGGGQLKQAARTLTWKFKKEEIASILARMERLKTLVEIALQMDNL